MSNCQLSIIQGKCPLDLPSPDVLKNSMTPNDEMDSNNEISREGLFVDIENESEENVETKVIEN